MRRLIIIMICILFVLTGCKKEIVEEQNNYGDIIEDNINTMSYQKEYDISKYHLKIESKYEGQPYNKSIFSFIVNNENGMYLLNYDLISNNVNLNLYTNEISSNNKTYNYYIKENKAYLIYNIDNNYYLMLSINSLNNNMNDLEEGLLDNYIFVITIK